jgi:hypothetical protein
MTLAVCIFGAMLLDVIYARRARARGEMARARYELVSCTINVIAFAILLATVELGDVAKTLSILYALSQVYGIQKSSETILKDEEANR